MTEPEIVHRSRRATSRRRLRTRFFVGLGAVAIAAAIVGTLIATNVIALPDDGSAGPAGPGADRTPSGSSTPNRPAGTDAKRRDLSPTDPLRLWIAGDSLAGSVGPSLGELTAETGVVQPEYDSRVSSGLLNPNFFDWPEHAAEQLQLIDPEVVVFLIGTNDASVWDPDLVDEYRLRTELMMRLLAKDGREVYWVGPPVAKGDDLEAGVKAVGLIARQTAAKVPGVTYVDTHEIFDDENGEYQYRFENELGVSQIMRAGDGIHFSVDGADLLGRAIFRLLDADWRITPQARPDQPLQVRETEGSTQVPGTHRSIQVQTGSTRPSGGSSSGGSTTTTAAASSSTSTTTTPSESTTTTTSEATTTTTTAPPGP